MLTDQGYNTKPPDGLMNSPTQKAIRRFQKNNGIKTDGELNKKTILSIFEKSCKRGCEFDIILAQSDIDLLSSLPLSDIRSFSGTILERIFIMELQKILNELGYNAGIPDGIMGSDTRKAIRKYQKERKMKSSGNLDKQTAVSVYSEYCGSGCQITIAMKIRGKQGQTATSKKVKKFKPIKKTNLNIPVNINDKAFAVEKFECSDISGDWLIFFEGTVTDKSDETITLRLEKRFGYRYHPDKEGIDKKDWWCIPKRRHCYSSIKFSDWDGKYSEKQVVSFTKDKVYNARIKIINGMSIFLQQNCSRKLSQ